MTIQERIDSGCIYTYLKEGYREATVEEFGKAYPFLEGYIKRVNWWHWDNKKVAILKSTKEENYYHLYMFTDKHVYSIVVKPTYIGCVMSCRYERPMEGWTRGSDFPDGECNEDTFKSILYAILCQELVDYNDGSQPPMADEEYVEEEK